MSGLRWAAVLVAVAAGLVGGCKGASEDDDSPSFVPKVVAFEGKLEPQYSGLWTSSDGASSLELGKDGALKIGTTSHSQNGTSTSHEDGQWLVSGSELRLRYSDASGQQTVLAYTASLSGNAMTLQQTGGKMKTKYSRK